MGCFRFALQPALDVARVAERTAGAASLRAGATLAQARAACDDVRTRRDQARVLALAPTTRASVAAIASDLYVDRLRVVAVRRDRARCVAEHAVATARAAYEHAHGRRIALERMRDRRSAEHRALEELREACALDESNAQRRSGAARWSQAI